MSAWIGLAELALGGCTTTTDHLYVHPRGGGDLISAEIRAAARAGRALPPDARLDEPVGEGRRAPARLGRAGRRRDPRRQRAARRAAPRPRAGRDGADRARTVLAVLGDARADARDRRAGRTPRRAAAHAPRRGPRRGHASRRSTSGARTIDHFEEVGWVTRPQPGSRTASTRTTAEVARLGQLGRRRRALPELEHDDRRRRHRAGAASCAPRASPVGLGCDGSASTDSASLWMEARNALLLGRLRGGPASTGARRRARDRDARRGRVPRPRRRDRRAVGRARSATSSCWPLEATRVRGRAQRPGRGVAAVRAGRGAPHGRRTAGWWSRTARSSRPASTRCSRATAPSAPVSKRDPRLASEPASTNVVEDPQLTQVGCGSVHRAFIAARSVSAAGARLAR